MNFGIGGECSWVYQGRNIFGTWNTVVTILAGWELRMLHYWTVIVNSAPWWTLQYGGHRRGHPASSPRLLGACGKEFKSSPKQGFNMYCTVNRLRCPEGLPGWLSSLSSRYKMSEGTWTAGTVWVCVQQCHTSASHVFANSTWGHAPERAIMRSGGHFLASSKDTSKLEVTGSEENASGPQRIEQ